MCGNVSKEHVTQSHLYIFKKDTFKGFFERKGTLSKKFLGGGGGGGRDAETPPAAHSLLRRVCSASFSQVNCLNLIDVGFSLTNCLYLLQFFAGLW